MQAIQHGRSWEAPRRENLIRVADKLCAASYGLLHGTEKARYRCLSNTINEFEAVAGEQPQVQMRSWETPNTLQRLAYGLLHAAWTIIRGRPNNRFAELEVAIQKYRKFREENE